MVKIEIINLLKVIYAMICLKHIIIIIICSVLWLEDIVFELSKVNKDFPIW